MAKTLQDIIQNEDPEVVDVASKLAIKMLRNYMNEYGDYNVKLVKLLEVHSIEELEEGFYEWLNLSEGEFVIIVSTDEVRLVREIVQDYILTEKEINDFIEWWVN